MLNSGVWFHHYIPSIEIKGSILFVIFIKFVILNVLTELFSWDRHVLCAIACGPGPQAQPAWGLDLKSKVSPWMVCTETNLVHTSMYQDKPGTFCYQSLNSIYQDNPGTYQNVLRQTWYIQEHATMYSEKEIMKIMHDVQIQTEDLVHTILQALPLCH